MSQYYNYEDLIYDKLKNFVNYFPNYNQDRII